MMSLCLVITLALSYQFLLLYISVNLELINSLWVPNIFIYNLKTFQTISVLSKLAGLWIDRRKRVYYSQATHITFICPMLFHSFPLDTQVCKFQVKKILRASYFLIKIVRLEATHTTTAG